MGVANQIENFFRAFLWGGMGEEAKFLLMSWQKLFYPIEYGGLGVQNLCIFNKAILG